MEANEMRAKFLLGYEAGRLANRTFNDREIEDFLNKAQLEFTKERYAAWKNRPQIGFEGNSIRTSELAGLLTSTVSVDRQHFLLGTANNGAFKSPDLDKADQPEDKYGVFVGMPDEVLYPIIETCETTKAGIDKENVTIEEVGLVEYKSRIHDSYAKPYDNLVWSMDWGSYTASSPTAGGVYDPSTKNYSSQGVSYNMQGLNYLGAAIEINTLRARYLLPGKGWKITNYVIHYVKYPTDIHIDVQTPSLQVSCLMPAFVHQDIIDKAVKLASAAIVPEPNKYQVNQIESKEDE